ncbi:MAG: MarR family winged helix-turn-helix transcriptional regulator [Myxococcota bacterium]
MSVYALIMPPPPSDFDPTRAAGCACFALRKAARALTQVYDEALRPAGIRATQLSLLMVVHAAGPIAVSRLAELMVTDRTTMSRNLKPLDSDGLLRIRRGGDRRVHEVSLTRRGRELVKRAFPLWEQVQERTRAMLGDERLQRMLGDLAVTVEAADVVDPA